MGTGSRDGAGTGRRQGRDRKGTGRGQGARMGQGWDRDGEQGRGRDSHGRGRDGTGTGQGWGREREQERGRDGETGGQGQGGLSARGHSRQQEGRHPRPWSGQVWGGLGCACVRQAGESASWAGAAQGFPRTGTWVPALETGTKWLKGGQSGCPGPQEGRQHHPPREAAGVGPHPPCSPRTQVGSQVAPGSQLWEGASTRPSWRHSHHSPGKGSEERCQVPTHNKGRPWKRAVPCVTGCPWEE